jgi:hypothetical protein
VDFCVSKKLRGPVSHDPLKHQCCSKFRLLVAMLIAAYAACF